MKKCVLPALILALALSLTACRMNNPMDTEPSTDTQPVTTTTSPTILPNPTIETNIPDPSVDTSMPMNDDMTGDSNDQIVG